MKNGIKSNALVHGRHLEESRVCVKGLVTDLNELFFQSWFLITARYFTTL